MLPGPSLRLPSPRLGPFAKEFKFHMIILSFSSKRSFSNPAVIVSGRDHSTFLKIVPLFG